MKLLWGKMSWWMWDQWDHTGPAEADLCLHRDSATAESLGMCSALGPNWL